MLPKDPTPTEAIDRIRAAFKPKDGFRTLHAKGAFYAGTFTPSPEAGKRCRALHFQAEVPIVVRWSNGGGNPRTPDGAPDVRGLAVSFKLPDGTATDLLGQTAPRFPVRTPAAFVELVEATNTPIKLAGFFRRHPDALRPLIANGKAKALISPKSYAEPTFYPVHAYRWTAPDSAQCWVRYTFRPQATKDDRLEEKFTGRDRLREEIAARLAIAPVNFTLEVQVAARGDDPHDPMSVWRSKEIFDAGTVTITNPTKDLEADAGVVVFDPTRVVDGIGLSDDPILRYRPGAYSESVEHRLA